MRLSMFLAAALGLLAAVSAAPLRAADTKLFQLPDGARVHDVAPAPDGTIWYTAQRQGRSASSIPRPARSAKFRSGPARRRTASSRVPTARLGSPTAARTRSSASIQQPRRSRSGSSRRRRVTPTSTPGHSTAAAFTGSRDRMAFTAGSIPRPANWMYSRIPMAAALMELRQHRRATFITFRWPAATWRRSIAEAAPRRSSNPRLRRRVLAGCGPTAGAICGCPNGIAAI